MAIDRIAPTERYVMSETKSFTPKELAAVIGVDPKVLRGHLRATYTRPIEVKNTTWIIPANVAAECVETFAKRRAAMQAPVAENDAK